MKAASKEPDHFGPADIFSPFLLVDSGGNAEGQVLNALSSAISDHATASPSTATQRSHDDEGAVVTSQETTTTTHDALVAEVQVVKDMTNKCIQSLIPCLDLLQSLNQELIRFEDKLQSSSNAIPINPVNPIIHKASHGETIPVVSEPTVSGTLQKDVNTNAVNEANEEFDKLYRVKGTYVLQGLSPADCFFSWYDREFYKCTHPMSKEKRKCFGVIHTMVSYMKLFLSDNTTINPKPQIGHPTVSTSTALPSDTLWQQTMRELAKISENNMLEVCNKIIGVDSSKASKSDVPSTKRKKISPLVSSMGKMLREIPFSKLPKPTNVVDNCMSNFPSLTKVEEFHKLK